MGGRAPRFIRAYLFSFSDPRFPPPSSFLKMLGLAHLGPQFLKLGYDDLELLEQLMDAVRVSLQICGVSTARTYARN
jgi:hypothetical protein